MMRSVTYEGKATNTSIRRIRPCCRAWTRRPIQGLDRNHPMLPMRPAHAERRTADDERFGTISLSG
jgi:hypothetical protein